MKKIPNFSLNLTDGSVFHSNDADNIILFFYPKALTPGCTIEANEFQDNLNKFQKLNFNIIGASKDTVNKNTQFAEKYELKYNLGSDESDACEKLGIWIEKSMYGKKYFGINRSTYIIGKRGEILKIWHNVKVNGHVNEVLKEIERLK